MRRRRRLTGAEINGEWSWLNSACAPPPPSRPETNPFRAASSPESSHNRSAALQWRPVANRCCRTRAGTREGRIVLAHKCFLWKCAERGNHERGWVDWRKSVPEWIPRADAKLHPSVRASNHWCFDHFVVCNNKFAQFHTNSHYLFPPIMSGVDGTAPGP